MAMPCAFILNCVQVVESLSEDEQLSPGARLPLLSSFLAKLVVL